MNRVVATAEQAEVAAEREREAWNLPRRPVEAAPQASTGARTTFSGDGLATGSSAIDPARAAGLDWQGFLSLYFAGRRRHDLEALTAYGAYRSSHDGDEPAAAEVVRLAASQAVSASATAADSWEDEGGSPAPLEEKPPLQLSRPERGRSSSGPPGPDGTEGAAHVDDH